jgi:site-specific recombinase XerD
VASPGARPARKKKAAREETPELADLLREARAYANSDIADRTRREYAKQWATFASWCRERNITALPASPKTLCLYLAHRARQGRSVATIAVGISAIAHQHARHNHPDPLRHAAVDRTWSGIRRTHGTAPNQKAPATTNVVRAMVESLPNGLLGMRDRALLTLGFAGGFRRSELVALDVSDLRFIRGAGLEVKLRRSKTDQERKGQAKEIALGARTSTCPVTAVKDWLELAEIVDGPVFRSVNRHGQVGETRLTAQVVALVVKRALAAAGVPNASYSGHSLRAGLVTTAKQRGVDDADIMKLTGHRSLQTLQGYDRRAKTWQNPASGRLGL